MAEKSLVVGETVFNGARAAAIERINRVADGYKFNTDWTHLFELNIHDNERSLENLMFELFMEWGRNYLDEKVVRNIIREISKQYNKNDYHNFLHACHVTLNCTNVLHRVVGVEMSPIERISLIFSALIHDVDHLGVPNTTLIKRTHELAKLYNDQSVAEMHSLAIGLNLIESGPDYDLLKNFSAEDRVLFRRNVIEIVLCTDIAEPMKKKMTFVKVDELSRSSPEGHLDVSGPSGRAALMCLIMRTCDIGSSTQSFRTLKIWAHHFFLELKTASSAGDGPLFTVDFFYTDQVCYMSAHVLFLVERLRATGHVDMEFADSLINNCTRNIEQWKEVGMALLSEWDDDSKEPVYE